MKALTSSYKPHSLKTICFRRINNADCRLKFTFYFFLFFIAAAGSVEALEPHEILVVANRKAAGSIGIAKYYMAQRNIPEGNFLSLWVTDREHCSRDVYNRSILRPIRRFLKRKSDRGELRCLLMMYGIPLKVENPKLTKEEKQQIGALKKRKEALQQLLDARREAGTADREELKKQFAKVNSRLKQIRMSSNRSASVDSEVALALVDDYSLSSWQLNPYCLGYGGKPMGITKDQILMVSRLDGPSIDIVRRIIDDGLAAEKSGLRGVFYLDARWPMPKNFASTIGYRFYDQSIHRAGVEVNKSGILPVVVESTSALFQPGQCPNAALYCGWYSRARYVDAFKWQRGAIGFHIASSECTTLKKKNSQVWCKRMLEDGIAATIGPVSEPYVQAFPYPDIFFKFLVDGYLTLVECYFISLPYLSWKMVLIGDPLYRPFNSGLSH